jgi:mono/diheme cytochrome c family protein
MTSRDFPTTLLIALAVLSAMAFSPSWTSAEENPAALGARFGETAIPFLQKHCLACHGEKEPKADLSLVADRDAATVVKRRAVWESVVEMVESGQMPPNEKPKPEAAEVESFVTLVRAVFDDSDRNAKPDPGRVTVRRLNRVEYNHTIRDLMGVDFDAAEDFPSDDIGHGFDNIGDVLTVSPVLMERYLAAAETIVNRAITPNPPKPPHRHQSGRYLEPAGQGVSDKRFRAISTKPGDNAIETGPLHTPYVTPDDGEYIFRVKCYAETEGAAGEAAEPVQIAILVCGKKIENGASDEDAAKLSGLAVKGLRPFVIVKTVEVKARSAETAEPIEVRIPPTRGFERMAVAIVKPAEGKPPVTLHVESFVLEGPLDTRPASHRKLLACDPAKSKPEQTREVLSRFLSRAYRRPATNDEVERLVVLATLAQDDGLSWEAAMQRAFMAALVSPKFLFRLELDDRPDSPEPRPLDEFQLASRLSYFLWSTMPDDELFDLAGRGELTKNLDAQVRRMLTDPKSKSLVDNFAMQWLQLQRLKSVSPDKKLFPSFDERLRVSMQRETELFVDAIIREDRSVLDLLDADFTFLNEPLARHYGLSELLGNRGDQRQRRFGGRSPRDAEFVRVTLPNSQRGGLLTQASLLTVTSNPTRTSPVKRGRWILEQILGAPPPPPPANVPELPEGEKAQLTGSLRQRMEQHRANPACANCHAKMDPIGFALENYDAIGAFRTKDGEFPIETAGVLPDGKAFQGPAELKSILKEKRNQFTRCLTEKLLIYALGRGLEYYDRRPVMKIQAALAKNDYKFSVLVTEIVKSDPFRMRRGSN